MELIVGCRNKTEMKILDKFLEGFEKISLNFDITNKAIELLKLYRLGHGLLIADSFIAATAIILDSPLLSKNQKDYKFIKELELQKYPV
jgi:predicted nucleic acid-binding protein